MAKGSDINFLRPFTLADYEEYATWWEGEPPSLDSLPRYGIVAGDMHAVGFIANTDTNIGILTFWYANPENSAKQTYKALTEIIRESLKINKKYVFCFTNEHGMKKLLKKNGFIERDKGHLIAEVKK